MSDSVLKVIEQISNDAQVIKKMMINIPLPPEDENVVKLIAEREKQLDVEKEAKSQKVKEKLQVLAPNPEFMFQAIGIISGVLSKEGRQFSVSLRGHQYLIHYSPYFKKKRGNLLLEREFETNPEKPVRLVVYPKLIHFPEKEKPYKLEFQVVLVDLGNRPHEGATTELNDFEFKISGIWQFIPVCRTPCITVMKNFTSDRLEFIKNAPPHIQVSFMKASHIPLLWRDAPVKAFRFNPKLDKEQQDKTYFVSIKAKFLPDKAVFGFDSICSIPSEKAPPYLKVNKKVKAEALALKAKNNKTKESKKTNGR